MRTHARVVFFVALMNAGAVFSSLADRFQGAVTNTALLPEDQSLSNPPAALLTLQRLEETERALLEALDRAHQQTEANFAQIAESTTRQLSVISNELIAQREITVRTIRHSTRITLTVAVMLAGFFAASLILLSWFANQVLTRAIRRLPAIPYALSWDWRQIAFTGGHRDIFDNSIERTSARLQSALERVERRLLQLETTSSQSRESSAATAQTQTSGLNGPTPSTRHPETLAASKTVPHIALILGDGEALGFMPHNFQPIKTRSWQGFVRKLKRLFRPAPATKGH